MTHVPNSEIPIYCEASFPINSLQTVHYYNKLMNCKILERHFCMVGQFYIVKVIKYPAKQGIRK